MATDPIPVRRRYDMQSLSEAIQVIAQALNLGACSINQNSANVPARYVLFPLRSYSTTFGLLPAPYDAGVGARVVISDALLSHIDGLGTVITVGGGDNIVPLYSTGADWVIG